MTDDTSLKLKRRLLVLRLGALPSVAALAPLAAEARPLAPATPDRAVPVQGYTDSDPSDGPGRGRGPRRGNTGITDSDPSDGPGQGRGARRGTGITDADPSDGPGNGRGGARRQTGITDSDPSDGPGQGRGRVRTGMTDSDPSDGAGYGRRGR